MQLLYLHAASNRMTYCNRNNQEQGMQAGSNVRQQRLALIARKTTTPLVFAAQAWQTVYKGLYVSCILWPRHSGRHYGRHDCCMKTEPRCSACQD